MNEETKNVFAAVVYSVEHNIISDALCGIAEYSETGRADKANYINGVNDMARELIREIGKLVDND